MREDVTLKQNPPKDSLLVDNMAPITLLNDNSNILAYFLEKYGLDDLIDECQAVWVYEVCHISSVILVLDSIDCHDLVLDPSLILFLDFQKPLILLAIISLVNCGIQLRCI